MMALSIFMIAQSKKQKINLCQSDEGFFIGGNMEFDIGILVMANHDLNDFELQESKEELIELAKACEIEVEQTVFQNIKVKSSAYYIGTGKVEEVKAAVDDAQANVVVFNVGLTPSQLRNLTQALGVEVMDKNMLILEIFSRRAHSPLAKAQVEIANLKYMMSRMVGSYDAYGRQAGGRNKGLGETKLELDRRHADKRILYLSHEIKKLQVEEDIRRKRRVQSSIPRVSLVGYTNAGKSSLMNILLEDSEKEVFVKDQVFASLDTQARSITIDDKHSFILTDTVGFVRDLPHTLIDAFHATLTEVREADLLLHVIDISNPFYEQHIEVIENTIQEIEAGDIPILRVYNKIDKMDIEYVNNTHSFYISALHNIGIETLLEVIKANLWQDLQEIEVLFPYDKMKEVDLLMRNAVILKHEQVDEGIYMKVAISFEKRHLVEGYIIKKEQVYEA